MKFKILGGNASVIPTGVTEEIIIQVRDEYATYHFKDAKITKAFVRRQIADGVKTEYIERIQTALCHYPRMSQKEIVDHIAGRIKALEKGGNK